MAFCFNYFVLPIPDNPIFGYILSFMLKNHKLSMDSKYLPILKNNKMNKNHESCVQN